MIDKKITQVLVVLLLAEVGFSLVRVPITRSKLKNESTREVEYEGYLAPLFGNIAETHIYYTSLIIGNQTFSVLLG
jgi:hypothetical protein